MYNFNPYRTQSCGALLEAMTSANEPDSSFVEPILSAAIVRMRKDGNKKYDATNLRAFCYYLIVGQMDNIFTITDDGQVILNTQRIEELRGPWQDEAKTYEEIQKYQKAGYEKYKHLLRPSSNKPTTPTFRF